MGSPRLWPSRTPEYITPVVATARSGRNLKVQPLPELNLHGELSDFLLVFAIPVHLE